MVFSTGEKTLERGGVDAGIAKLGRRAAGRCETFDRIPPLFRTFADAGKQGRLPSPCRPLQAVDAVGGVQHFFDHAAL